MSVVDEYFEALSSGKIGALEELLKKADEIGLDVNAVDSNGHNAYVIAINEGFDIIIKVLLSFQVQVGDALLYAVENDSLEAVNTLCSYASTLPEKDRLEIIDCQCATDEFPKVATPIIQAALKNNFTIVKILLENGVRVPDPEKDLERFTAPPGTLERSKEMLSIYRALTSDAYISGCSINPIQTSFALTSKMRSLSEKLEEFKSEFAELAHQVEAYAAKLLEQTRDTEEILTVLTFTEGQNVEPSISELAMVEFAIACSQKDFIAHPNCQKVVINQYYRHLISLRDSSTLKQVMMHLLIMVVFPFLSITYLVYPTKSIVRILQVPYVKFFMSVGSEIAFLALLIVDSLSTSREGPTYIAIQILITLWVIGKTWAEIERMTSNYEYFFGRDLMTSLHNFLLLVLLFAVFILRFIIFLQDTDGVPINNGIQKRSLDEADLQESEFLTQSIPSLKEHILLSLNDTETNVNSNLEDSLDTFLVNLMQELTCGTTSDQETSDTCAVPKNDRLNLEPNNPNLIIEALYALAIVVAFLRLSSIAVINEFIGPLQISLGGMAIDIACFGGIFSVVWLAFAIGMNQVQNAFQAIDYDICIRSMADDCSHGAFSSILSSLETFYWALLGNVGFTTAYIGNGRFVFSEWISIIFFALFVIVAVIILLNALIAMMSNTYCAVEENADTEWKFSRTATWMTYMNHSISLPPPFNIIPSPWTLCKKAKTQEQEDSNEQDTMNSVDEEYFKRKFQNVIGQLVERFVHESTADENNVEGGISIKDIQSLKSEVVSFRYECGNMLEVLSRAMDETVRQTRMTKDKLKITKEINDSATIIHKTLSEQKVSFSDMHADLKDISVHTTKQPRPPSPPKRQVGRRHSKVFSMASLFNEADVDGSLSAEAKDIFK